MQILSKTWHLQLSGLLLLAIVANAQQQKSPSADQQNEQHWKVVHTKDEMTDKEISGVATTSDDSNALLAIKCESGKVNVFVSGENVRPALDGQFNCAVCTFSRWYGHYQTHVRLRFDSQKETGFKDWIQVDAHTLMAWQLPSHRDLVRKLMEAHRFLVQYNVLGGGTEVLSFDVSGLREAIKQVPECKVD